MLQVLLYWALSSLMLFVIAALLPGMAITNFGAALIATLVLSVINLVVKPLLVLLTLPINLLTLGLFSFVINALMLMLAAAIVPGFEISSFWMALVGSLFLAVLTGLVFRGPDNRSANTV